MFFKKPPKDDAKQPATKPGSANTAAARLAALAGSNNAAPLAGLAHTSGSLFGNTLGRSSGSIDFGFVSQAEGHTDLPENPAAFVNHPESRAPWPPSHAEASALPAEAAEPDLLTEPPSQPYSFTPPQPSQSSAFPDVDSAPVFEAPASLPATSDSFQGFVEDDYVPAPDASLPAAQRFESYYPPNNASLNTPDPMGFVPFGPGMQQMIDPYFIEPLAPEEIAAYDVPEALLPGEDSPSWAEDYAPDNLSTWSAPSEPSVLEDLSVWTIPGPSLTPEEAALEQAVPLSAVDAVNSEFLPVAEPDPLPLTTERLGPLEDLDTDAPLATPLSFHTDNANGAGYPLQSAAAVESEDPGFPFLFEGTSLAVGGQAVWPVAPMPEASPAETEETETFEALMTPPALASWEDAEVENYPQAPAFVHLTEATTAAQEPFSNEAVFAVEEPAAQAPEQANLWQAEAVASFETEWRPAVDPTDISQAPVSADALPPLDAESWMSAAPQEASPQDALWQPEPPEFAGWTEEAPAQPTLWQEPTAHAEPDTPLLSGFEHTPGWIAPAPATDADADGFGEAAAPGFSGETLDELSSLRSSEPMTLSVAAEIAEAHSMEEPDFLTLGYEVEPAWAESVDPMLEAWAQPMESSSNGHGSVENLPPVMPSLQLSPLAPEQTPPGSFPEEASVPPELPPSWSSLPMDDASVGFAPLSAMEQTGEADMDDAEDDDEPRLYSPSLEEALAAANANLEAAFLPEDTDPGLPTLQPWQQESLDADSADVLMGPTDAESSWLNAAWDEELTLAQPALPEEGKPLEEFPAVYAQQMHGENRQAVSETLMQNRHAAPAVDTTSALWSFAQAATSPETVNTPFNEPHAAAFEPFSLPDPSPVAPDLDGFGTLASPGFEEVFPLEGHPARVEAALPAQAEEAEDDGDTDPPAWMETLDALYPAPHPRPPMAGFIERPAPVPTPPPIQPAPSPPKVTSMPPAIAQAPPAAPPVEPAQVIQVDNWRLDALQVLASYSIGPEKYLYFVEMDGSFALMGQSADQVSMLKLFPQNPMATDYTFSATREVQVGGKDMFLVRLGSWQAVISADNQTIRLQTVLNS
jgi:hypothetical protein